MKLTGLPLALALAGAVALPFGAPADAAIIDVTIPGVTPSNFDLTINTTTESILGFTIQGYSIPAGFTSTITLDNGNYSAYYEAQLTVPEVGGDNLNYDFGLDLEALNTPFPSPSGGTDPAGDAIALLTDTTQLETNLDTVTNDPTATLGYNLTNSNYFFLIHYDVGTPVAGTSDPLASPASGSPLDVAAPEPASITLLATSLLGFVTMRRRRQNDPRI
jgi:hypothetical protein